VRIWIPKAKNERIWIPEAQNVIRTPEAKIVTIWISEAKNVRYGSQKSRRWRSENQKQRMGEPDLWSRECEIRIPEPRNAMIRIRASTVRFHGKTFIRIHPNWWSYVSKFHLKTFPKPPPPPLPCSLLSQLLPSFFEHPVSNREETIEYFREYNSGEI
jgi:hypothetical protein